MMRWADFGVVGRAKLFGVGLPTPERYEAEEMRHRFTLRRINELYDNGDFSAPEYASSVRRHAILHGVFDSYGDMESLRLFFLLELLHDALDDVGRGLGRHGRLLRRL